MRRRLTALTLMTIFVLALSFPFSSGCADCSKGGTVDNSCQEEKDQAFTGCCSVFGCGIGQPGYEYCQNRGEEAYNGCALRNGCPNLLQ